MALVTARFPSPDTATNPIWVERIILVLFEVVVAEEEEDVVVVVFDAKTSPLSILGEQ